MSVVCANVVTNECAELQPLQGSAVWTENLLTERGGTQHRSLFIPFSPLLVFSLWLTDQSDPWSEPSQIKLVAGPSEEPFQKPCCPRLDPGPDLSLQRKHKKSQTTLGAKLTLWCFNCWPLTLKHCRLKRCTEIFGFYKLCVPDLVKLCSIIVTS